MAPRSLTQGGKHEAFEDSGRCGLDRLGQCHRRQRRPCDTGNGRFIGSIFREDPANAHDWGLPPRKGLLLLQAALLASLLSSALLAPALLSPALLSPALLASALLVKSNLHKSIMNLFVIEKPT